LIIGSPTLPLLIIGSPALSLLIIRSPTNYQEGEGWRSNYQEGEGWNHINWINPTTCLHLSQAKPGPECHSLLCWMVGIC
jgi:hypothetical protein